MDILQSLRKFITQHDLLAHGATVIAGVSGGPDSLCLLHALKTLAPEYDLRLHIAHLNHQLRGAEADADAEFVRQIADEWHLPCTIESRDVAALAKTRRLSTEEAARQARYAFLIEVAAAQHSDTIAVAHNADDQAESVLMHFLRGSGLTGLRGMLPKMRIAELRTRNEDSALPISHSARNDQYLIRPLLAVPRALIEEYCLQNNLLPRRDATNADITYFRNRLRHELLPVLETYNPNIRAVLCRTANVIAAEYEVLAAHLNYAWDMTVIAETAAAITFNLLMWREQPLATQRAMLRRAIHQLRPPLRDIDFVHIEDGIELLKRAHTGDQATLPQNLLLEVSYDTFTITPRDQLSLPDWPLLPESTETQPITVPGATLLPESAWVIEAVFEACDKTRRPLARFAACFDADTLPAPLAMRLRMSTDHFHPQGMPVPVRLKDWMISVKVPRAVRDRLPLIVAGNQIVWVPGFRVGQPFVVTEKTQRIIKLVFKNLGRSSPTNDE